MQARNTSVVRPSVRPVFLGLDWQLGRHSVGGAEYSQSPPPPSFPLFLSRIRDGRITLARCTLAKCSEMRGIWVVNERMGGIWAAF